MDHTQYSRLLYHCNTVVVILTFSCYEFQNEFIFLRLKLMPNCFSCSFTNTIYRLPGIYSV